MACTPYITRYAKLISTSEMPEGQKPRKAITAKEFKELGKCTYNFYIDMSNIFVQECLFKKSIGNYIIYVN